MLNRCITVFAIAALGGLSVPWECLQAQKPATTPLAPVDFVRDIQPILQNTCSECHGPTKVKAKLRLDSRAGVMKGGDTGAVVVPGNSDKSLIVRRLLGLDGEDRMPKDGDPLPAAQIALIRSWIDQGAIGPDTGTRRSVPRTPARRFRRTGRIAGRPVLRSPMCAGRNGRGRRSIGSSSPGSRRKGWRLPPRRRSKRSSAASRST